jgi:hypothetical protein
MNVSWVADAIKKDLLWTPLGIKVNPMLAVTHCDQHEHGVVAELEEACGLDAHLMSYGPDRNDIESVGHCERPYRVAKRTIVRFTTAKFEISPTNYRDGNKV